VLFKTLSVIIKDNGKVCYAGKADTTTAESFFLPWKEVPNGTDFNTIGLTKNTNSGWFEFLDDALLKGKVYYRIKLTSGQNSSWSENVCAVLSADISCKFYPNPVDKALIVVVIGVELPITDRFGKPMIAETITGRAQNSRRIRTRTRDLCYKHCFRKKPNRLITEKLVKKIISERTQ